MKKSQLNRLKKAQKKFNQIAIGNLTEDQIVNNFAYMLETVKRCQGGFKKDEKTKNS